MASSSTPVPLPEPLSSLLGACGSVPATIPLLRDIDIDSGTDSDRDIHVDSAGSVSYTHLDVYKRQPLQSLA